MKPKMLLLQAIKAMENSYAPISNLTVGAAILTKSQKVYLGVNIENASYGATICAERVAIGNAIAAGEKEFLSLAVVSNSQNIITPCGICRQVLSEFFCPGSEIICGNSVGEFTIFTMETLLPHAFDKFSI